jgi:predicted porin
MKKSLLAVAILGATSSFAFAASNVTLYGVIDTGVKVQRIDGAKSGNTVSMTSGFKAPVFCSYKHKKSPISASVGLFGDF